MKRIVFALLLAFTGCTYNVSQQQLTGNHRRVAQAVGITNQGIQAAQYSEGEPSYCPPQAPQYAPQPQPNLGIIPQLLQGIIQVNVGPGYINSNTGYSGGGNGYYGGFSSFFYGRTDSHRHLRH